jgi:hypothetical protein
MEGVPGGPSPPVHSFLLTALRATPGIDATHAALVTEAIYVCESEAFHTALSDQLDAAFECLKGRMAAVFERAGPAAAGGGGGGAKGAAKTESAETATGGEGGGDSRVAVALLIAYLIKIPTWVLPDGPERKAAGAVDGAAPGGGGPSERLSAGAGAETARAGATGMGARQATAVGYGGAAERKSVGEGGGEGKRAQPRPNRPASALGTLGAVESLGALCWDIFSTQPRQAHA